MLDNLPHPENRSTVLAIGAHPDDAVLSVGGILARFALQGCRVVVLTLTSGDLAGESSLREAEDTEAMRRLGGSVEFARLSDGHLAVRQAIMAIDLVIGRYNPALALVHSRQDTHQDHVTAFEAALVSCRKIPSLFTYESPSSLGFRPTVTLDVTENWECKMHALRAYTSQMRDGRLLSWAESVAKFRSWPRHVGAMCEGLRACHSQSLPMLDTPTVYAPALKSTNYAL